MRIRFIKAWTSPVTGKTAQPGQEGDYMPFLGKQLIADGFGIEVGNVVIVETREVQRPTALLDANGETLYTTDTTEEEVEYEIELKPEKKVKNGGK